MQSTNSELEQLERRLLAIDARLQHARRARDEYIEFLKKKYPQWKPPDLPTYDLAGKPIGVVRIAAESKYLPCRSTISTKLIDQLATSKYHWDIKQRRPSQRVVSKDLQPNDPIPSSGPMLETDLARIRRRLNEISSDLRILRDHRIHLSSADFYRSIEPSTFAPTTSAASIQSRQNTSLLELRKKLNEIEPNIVPDTPEPTKADLNEMRAEQILAKYQQQVNTAEDNNTKRAEAFEQVDVDKGLGRSSTVGNEPAIAPRRTIVFNTEQSVVRAKEIQPAEPTEPPKEKAEKKHTTTTLLAENYDGDQMMSSSKRSPNYQRVLGMLNGGGAKSESSSDSDSLDAKVQSSTQSKTLTHSRYQICPFPTKYALLGFWFPIFKKKNSAMNERDVLLSRTNWI
ncbi:hypothetical protein Tcan_05985 [Toxocara canis]|uniref:Uncharacterized protein n=1 Tax=Toxocara canis TaxID=6265 RepID=A0A0B2VKF7_TOXCA|nr:hypothetical protein Tcan_05985 [Toxocara canis]